VSALPRLVDVCAPESDPESEAACEAVLLFWYAGEGYRVVADQDLAEIETAKAVVVVKAPSGGVLQEVLVREGDAVDAAQRPAVIRCEA
jgi:pyruvate/2-oxoglutarate dehydrogenase complex dihydrolipoamide acyltransferase (E2) component